MFYLYIMIDLIYMITLYWHLYISVSMSLFFDTFVKKIVLSMFAFLFFFANLDLWMKHFSQIGTVGFFQTDSYSFLSVNETVN